MRTFKTNIICSSVGNKIVDNSDVVGAAPVQLYHHSHLASMNWAEATAKRGKIHLNVGIWCIILQV